MKVLLIGWFDEEAIKEKYNIKAEDLYIISDKARRMVYKAKKTPNVFYIDNVNELTEYKNILEGIGMKFDKVIMNPPYEKNLHLKILNEVMSHVDKDGEVINLSPIRWLQDPLKRYKTSDFINYYESIALHIKSLEEVSLTDMIKYFNANFTVDCGVYKLTNKTHDSIIEKYDNKLVDKIINRAESSIKDHIVVDNQDGWCVRLCEMRPMNNCQSEYRQSLKFELLDKNRSYIFKDGYTQDKKHWSSLMKKGGIKTFTEKDIMNLTLHFKTKKEAINFENSTKTNFYRWCVYTMKTDAHMPFKYLPYMGDYTEPWTDERFYKYFKLTKAEIKLIEDTMKEYM